MRLLAALCLGVTASAALGPITTLAGQPQLTPLRILVLPSSGPHTISSFPNDVVTFHLRIAGMVIDKHVGGKAVTGHGHLQIYLDRIPRDAYTKRDLKNIVNIVAAASYSIGFDAAWIKLHRGRHTLLLTLAGNNDILYRTTPARFSLTVK
jgi:hypothetical protein